MIQGEPLEETPEKDAEDENALVMGPVMHAPDADRATKPEAASDYLSRTIESVIPDAQDDAHPDEDTLDSDVDELVNALAEAEAERDDDWREAAEGDDDDPEPQSGDDSVEGAKDVHDDVAEDAQDDPADVATDSGNAIEETGESLAEKRQETDALIDAVMATSSEEPSDPEAEKAVEASIALTAMPTTEQEEASPGLLGLQAISVLNDKITSSEGRYDDALTKIGHALGLIAERIDGLETRMTSQVLSPVSLTAMSSSLDDSPIDDSVAPYIARAERELKARKESGSMDIFDRIAKAAESEFDGQVAGAETRIIENPGDGRRVGTKRWQPSKTVKRRMEQLEKARSNGGVEEDAPAETRETAARALRSDIDAITATAGGTARAETRAATAPEPVLDLELDDEEDDDSGLSVLPGARGRRRNRARKSRLDEDFENVFVEDEGKPSIQSLRRKMRDRPIEEPEPEEVAKGGMLGNILGKKAAKKVVPVEMDDIDDIDDLDEDDEDALMAAFDAPEERTERTTGKPAKTRRSITTGDDELGEGRSRARFGRGPLLYVLIAGAAAAGFFVWKTYLA